MVGQPVRSRQVPRGQHVPRGDPISAPPARHDASDQFLERRAGSAPRAAVTFDPTHQRQPARC